MKSKKLVYALLILALIVWGIIAYRVISTFKKDEPAPLAANKTHALIKSEAAVKDFKIVADYRDPFLEKPVKREPGKITSTAKPVQKKIPVSTLSWPQIKFGGMIRTQKQPLALVTINGKEKIMKEKDSIFEITLAKVYRDSAEFVYKKEKKIVKK